MQTLAAVLTEPGRPLQIWALDIPELKAGQVLIDVEYSGVCRSQLLEVRGKRGPDRFLPHTLGHEGSGTVAAAGPGVKKVKTGDRVVLSWIKGDGASVPATIYSSPSGNVNSGAISTFMQRTVTCESRVTPLPEGIALREAALLGCAIPTGAGIALHAAELEPGSRVAVFGVGGIGLSAVIGAVLRQASVVIAVDIFDHKLEQARRLGATHLINTRQKEPVAAIHELTQGLGVDCAIEAAGRRETMEAAFKAVRDGGGLCVLAGNLPYGERISLDPMDLIRGKRIAGSWGGQSHPDRDIPKFVDLYKTGKLDLGCLITKEYGLEQINAAFEDLEEGRLARALVRIRPR